MADQQKKSTKLSLDDPAVHARPRWAQAGAVFGAFIVVMFNLVVVMSAVERYSRGRPMVFGKEIFMFLVVLFFDVVMLYPIVFEVDMAKVTDDALIIKTLFFKKVIPWTAITSFTMPVLLKLALLRTRRCCYFINKRSLRRFDELAKTIKDRTSRA